MQQKLKSKEMKTKSAQSKFWSHKPDLLGLACETKETPSEICSRGFTATLSLQGSLESLQRESSLRGPSSRVLLPCRPCPSSRYIHRAIDIIMVHVYNVSYVFYYPCMILQTYQLLRNLLYGRADTFAEDVLTCQSGLWSGVTRPSREKLLAARPEHYCHYQQTQPFPCLILLPLH